MSACAVPLPLRPVPELSASGPRSHLGLDSGDGQYWPFGTRGSWAGLGWAAGGRRGPKVGSSQGPCWEAQPKSKARSGSGWGWWAEVQRAKLLGRPWAGRSGTRAQARHAARAPRAEVSFQRRRVTDVLSRTNCDLPPGLALRAFPAKDKQDGEAGSAGALGARSGAAWGSGLPAQGVCPTWHPRRSQGSLRPFLGAGLSDLGGGPGG